MNFCGSSSAESDGESSDVLDMSEPAASSSKPMPLSRNHYAQRFGAKQPTVKLNTFVKGADKSTVICQQAAVWLLGVGKPRIQRAA